MAQIRKKRTLEEVKISNAKAGSVKNPRKGFGTNRELASNLAKARWAKWRAENERTRELQDMGLRGHEAERPADTATE